MTKLSENAKIVQNYLNDFVINFQSKKHLATLDVVRINKPIYSRKPLIVELGKRFGENTKDVDNTIFIPTNNDLHYSIRRTDNLLNRIIERLNVVDDISMNISDAPDKPHIIIEIETDNTNEITQKHFITHVFKMLPNDLAGNPYEQKIDKYLNEVEQSMRSLQQYAFGDYPFSKEMAYLIKFRKFIDEANVEFINLEFVKHQGQIHIDICDADLFSEPVPENLITSGLLNYVVYCKTLRELKETKIYSILHGENIIVQSDTNKHLDMRLL